MRINAGGVLTVDDSGTFLANRLGNGSLNLQGGTLNILGGASGAQEGLGSLNVLGGNSTIRLNAPSSTATLAIGGVGRPLPGATISFVAGTGQKFGVADLVTIGGLPPFLAALSPLPPSPTPPLQ